MDDALEEIAARSQADEKLGPLAPESCLGCRSGPPSWYNLVVHQNPGESRAWIREPESLGPFFAV